MLVEMLARNGSVPFGAGVAIGAPMSALRPRLVAEAERILALKRLAQAGRSDTTSTDPYRDLY
jgi:hypothetical protein